MILLDSTAIVGFLDADDALHEVAVAALRKALATDTLAASVISYAEVMTGVGVGHHSADGAERFFDVLIKDLLPVDRAIASRAASLRTRRRSLKMPDALILATGDLERDVGTVVCADDDWPKVGGLSCEIELLKP